MASTRRSLLRYKLLIKFDICMWPKCLQFVMLRLVFKSIKQSKLIYNVWHRTKRWTHTNCHHLWISYLWSAMHRSVISNKFLDKRYWIRSIYRFKSLSSTNIGRPKITYECQIIDRNHRWPSTKLFIEFCCKRSNHKCNFPEHLLNTWRALNI